MPTLHYNVMVPHISPSWLRHGTQVYYSGMGQSRIYAMPYSHLAAYVVITLVLVPATLTLWYHNINTFHLCHNGSVV